MIIKANSRKENEIKNNYKIIYQKIKEEIKSVVITKLLNQVQALHNNYQKLLKENALIKNDLIYILKRILLNKKEYVQINNSNINKYYQMKNIYSMPYLTNISYANKTSYNSILSYDNIRENNSINKRPTENRRYSLDDDTKKGNNISLDNTNNIQNKIDHYINSLYRHNFSEELISGDRTMHSLNKDQPLYDELFSRKHKNNPLISTDYNFKKISIKKNKKKLLNNNNYSNDIILKTENQKENNNHNNIKKNNNVLKVQRKNILKKNKKFQIRSNTNGKFPNSDNKNSKSLQYKNSRPKFSINKFIFK